VNAAEAPLVEVPLIEVRGISKRFPGVRALDDVSLRVGQAEVLALIGENGAGKSTLLKILAGVQPPDAGEILVAGRPVRFRGVEDALEAGVALIHQELNLADNLDIAGNIFLGREPRRLGLLDLAAMRREAGEWLAMVGLDLDPATPLAELPIGRQQLVEIAKALSTRARLLIMDEPTSSLSARETETLFRVVKELRRRGVSVIWISHRLGEVKELADRVVVLRDGRNAGEIADRAGIEHDRMIRMMVGRDIDRLARRPSHRPGDVMLAARDLRTPAHPKHPLSFEVRAGEIVGIAGLVGAGRTELLTTLFGVTPAVAGSIAVAGRHAAVPDRGHLGRPRARAGRPQAAGPRARDGRAGEHVACVLVAREPGGVRRLRERTAAGHRDDSGIGDQDPRRPAGGAVSLRRQPAEGGARQVAGHEAESAPARRADPGHRCGRQGGDLRPRPPARRRGSGGALRLERNGGDPVARRPGAGDA
jgi:ABC-type sugar transport system ATPase subunit